MNKIKFLNIQCRWCGHFFEEDVIINNNNNKECPKCWHNTFNKQT